MKKIKVSVLGLTALFCYIAFISWRLFFYAYSSYYRGQMISIRYNLTPLKTILNYIRNADRVSFDTWIVNLAGNIAAFVPLGFLLPLAFRNLGAVRTCAVAFLLILTAEMMQIVSRRGIFDVDDLLLNIIGSAIGYGVYKFGGKLF